MRGAPALSELSERVERLSEMLLPVSLPYPTAEREAWRSAKKATDAAKARLNQAAASAGNVAKLLERGHGLPPELREARRAFEDAQRREAEAKDVLGKALRMREQSFSGEVDKQLQQAGPTLVQLTRLLNAGFDPLVKLSQFALMKLPMRRALQAAVELPEALRRCTALVNAIAPPDREE